MFMDPMWHSWNDYDMGAIFGVKIQDNLGGWRVEDTCPPSDTEFRQFLAGSDLEQIS